MIRYDEMAECQHRQFEVQWRFNGGSPVYTCGGCSTIVGRVPTAKNDGAVGALELVAKELEGQGAEPWDRNSPAIRVIRFYISQIVGS